MAPRPAARRRLRRRSRPSPDEVEPAVDEVQSLDLAEPELMLGAEVLDAPRRGRVEVVDDRAGGPEPILDDVISVRGVKVRLLYACQTGARRHIHWANGVHRDR